MEGVERVPRRKGWMGKVIPLTNYLHVTTLVSGGGGEAGAGREGGWNQHMLQRPACPPPSR